MKDNDVEKGLGANEVVQLDAAAIRHQLEEEAPEFLDKLKKFRSGDTYVPGSTPICLICLQQVH